MGTGDLLRDLDRRLLPLLARGLDRLARAGLPRPRLLTVAALASVAVVLLVAVWVASRQPAPDTGLGEVVRVGVVDGQSIPGYVESSRTELAKLVAEDAGGKASTQTYALVTLKAYLAPDRLAPVLAGVSLAEVYARVPLPHRQTEIVHIPATEVPAEVLTGMAVVAQRKDQEAADFQELSGKLTGKGGEERRLRAVYSGGAQLAAAEAAAYRSNCSCLYAAVVRGAPAALDRVSRRSEVRAVDPAPEVRRLDHAVFLPPLPEQAGVVVRPPTDPPVSPSVAPEPARPVHPAPTTGTPDATPPASPTTEPPTSPAPSPSHSVVSPVPETPSPSGSHRSATAET